jgi:hypothetical protein
MSLFSEIVIPSIIIAITNIFSHESGSDRYEQITAIFGYAAAIFLAVSLILSILTFVFLITKIPFQKLVIIQKITYQIFLLNAVTAISRDYEKILKPRAMYMESQIKKFYVYLAKKLKK